MQAKKPGGSSGGGRSGELQGDEAQRNKKKKKKVSCFSNIKIFLVSECALMLAQGTVGAYLVSPPCQVRHGPLPQRGYRVPAGMRRGQPRRWGAGGHDLCPATRLASGAEAAAGGAAGPGCWASGEPAGPWMPAGGWGDLGKRGSGQVGVKPSLSPTPL